MSGSIETRARAEMQRHRLGACSAPFSGDSIGLMSDVINHLKLGGDATRSDSEHGATGSSSAAAGDAAPFTDGRVQAVDRNGTSNATGDCGARELSESEDSPGTPYADVDPAKPIGTAVVQYAFERECFASVTVGERVID